MIKINANMTLDYNLAIEHEAGSAPQAEAAPVLKSRDGELALPKLQFLANDLRFAHNAVLAHSFLWLRHIENQMRTGNFSPHRATFTNKGGNVAFTAEFAFAGLESGTFNVRVATSGTGASIDDCYDNAATFIADTTKLASDALGKNIAITMGALRGNATHFANLPGHIRAFNPT